MASGITNHRHHDSRQRIAAKYDVVGDTPIVERFDEIRRYTTSRYECDTTLSKGTQSITPNMPITFYTISEPSPPARAVEIVMKILGLDVEKRVIDLMKKENREPWFAELNPTLQVPVIDDDGYVLTDSHAIIAYLLTTYASEEILEQYYPTDPKERGIIHSKWHFENGIIFARIKTIFFPLVFWSETTVPLEKTRWLLEGVYFLERFLDGKKWLASDRLTVADISAITTIDVVELLVPLKYYKNVSAWAKRTREACPFYEECGAEQVKQFATHFKENYTYNADDRWNEIQRDVNEDL